MGVDFFKSLYEDDVNYEQFVVRGAFPRFSDEEKQKLKRDVNDEEINSALFSMSGWKAPGLDDLPTNFY